MSVCMLSRESNLSLLQPHCWGNVWRCFPPLQRLLNSCAFQLGGPFLLTKNEGENVSTLCSFFLRLPSFSVVHLWTALTSSISFTPHMQNNHKILVWPWVVLWCQRPYKVKVLFPKAICDKEGQKQLTLVSQAFLQRRAKLAAFLQVLLPVPPWSHPLPSVPHFLLALSLFPNDFDVRSKFHNTNTCGSQQWCKG